MDKDKCYYNLKGKMRKELNVYEDRIEFLFEKNKYIVFYKDMISVFYKEAKLTAGYLRFILTGDVKTRVDVSSASMDENSILFLKNDNDLAQEITSFVQNKI